MKTKTMKGYKSIPLGLYEAIEEACEHAFNGHSRCAHLGFGWDVEELKEFLHARLENIKAAKATMFSSPEEDIMEEVKDILLSDDALCQIASWQKTGGHNTLVLRGDAGFEVGVGLYRGDSLDLPLSPMRHITVAIGLRRDGDFVIKSVYPS